MLTEALTATLGLAGLPTAATLSVPTRTVTTDGHIPTPPRAVWQVLTDGMT